MSRRRGVLYVVIVLILGGVWAVVGRSREATLPPLEVTTGTVTIDGKPLTAGLVTFVPDVSKGTAGPTGIGYIQRDGAYRIKTAQKDGAIVGRHKIRVTAVGTGANNEWPIPVRYNDPTESGLSGAVRKGEPNVVDLELTWNDKGGDEEDSAEESDVESE